MRRLLSPLTVFAITTALAAGVAAQTPAPAQAPPPMTNLTVFP